MGVLGIMAALPLAAQNVSSSQCAPDHDLNFVCGADHPEDLARIPGTSWLITSGFAPGAGLKLIDMRTRSMRTWFTGDAAQIQRDTRLYPDCAAPPPVSLFNARGINLRQRRSGPARLLVVNHGDRESVEVFDVLSGGRAVPRLVWKGCMLLPPGHVGNAVAGYRDGTVLVSVLTRPGTTITDFERGLATGGIYERAAGEGAFRLIPGTELPGNNGLETARDDRGFYSVAFGWRAIALFRRGAQTGPYAVVRAPGFMPDNVHWDGRRLLTAGMVADEPACGGTRKIIGGVADKMLCPRGWRVAELDVGRQRFTLVGQGNRSLFFNGVSAAVLAKGYLWLGSYQADRLAYVRQHVRAQ